MMRRTFGKSISKKIIVFSLSFFLVTGILAPYLPVKAAIYINRRMIPAVTSSGRVRVPRKKAIEKEEKRTEKSKTFLNPDGTFTINYHTIPIHVKNKDGKWVDKETHSTEPGLLRFLTMSLSSTPLSLCLYSAGCSFDEAGSKSVDEMNVYHYEINNVTSKSDCYLRYPNLRHLIPLDGTITNCSVVTTFEDPNATAFSISAFAINDSWDPANVTSTTLPTVSSTAAATTTWTLTPGSSRASRSVDITS